MSSLFPSHFRDPGLHAGSHPAWMRWMALACVLLFGLASTAQAAHIHGAGGVAGVHTAQAPTGGSNSGPDEEHCPLCVAMHWAMPVTMTAGPAPGVALVAVVRPCTEVVAPAAWYFARFSRPPPSRG